MDKKSKEFIEHHLRTMWLKLNLDNPRNWESLVSFVIDDVESASGYMINNDFHSGDVEIAFRRFIESKSY